jgi:triphosphoribosyl-dephospho-CoA synthase
MTRAVPGPAPQRSVAARLTLKNIGHAAALALYDELALSPKPGLVTLVDTGSHDDMDAHTFMRSLFSLRGYFVHVAGLGAARANFEALERCGIAAEKRMLEATGGINTHRGAIFTLGLLCAAAGAVAQSAHTLTPAILRHALLQRWGPALHARTQRPSTLPGGIAARRYALRSASEEARLGFPVLFETALPAMRVGASRGIGQQQVLLDTLFHVMAVMDDSNLAHRGGLPGLHFAQEAARGFLSAGGAAAPGGMAAATAIASEFVARRLSPGGAADTLAAACLVTRLQNIAHA